MVKTLDIHEWLNRKRDPWRLRCPECDSVNVTSRTAQKVITHETQHYIEKEIFENGHEYTGRYRCRSCQDNYEYLLDAKTGKHVRKERIAVQ
jgi:transposase-like protein